MQILQHAKTLKHMKHNQVYDLLRRGKNALLLRHAERDPFQKGSFGNHLPLNQQGKLSAFAFGEILQDLKIVKIYTSPVERCIQTAEYIRRGYGYQTEIIQTKALGAPGLYVSDEKLAGDYWLKYGNYEMYKHFTEGKYIPGLVSAEELKTSLTNFIVKNSQDEGLTLFISHDLMIAMYHFCLDQTTYSKQNWIDFLEGITFINGKYHGRFEK